MIILDFIQQLSRTLEGVLISVPTDNALGWAYVILQNAALILFNLLFGTSGGGGLFGGFGGF